MLLVACPQCLTGVRVIGEMQALEQLVGTQSEFWPDKYICVSCGSSCRGVLEHEVDGPSIAMLKIRELGPQEMFSAQMGLGTPDEMLCDIATVRELFGRSPVKKVLGHTVNGTTRSCLTELEFEDGVRMFFGASSHGAIVYRISRPVSYTKKVLEELDR